MPPPPSATLLGHHVAWFLDIDGTLLDIEARPDAVRVSEKELQLLESLLGVAEGALALVSGRSIAVLDALFAPMKVPVAGQHGAERRDAGGKVHRLRAISMQGVSGHITRFARRHAGLVVEDKGRSVALHYRLAPQLAAAAQEAVRAAAQAAGPAVEVMDGKMVFEVKPAGCDKGKAIAAFMREEPFAGRVPVFMGDDVTDELGFRVVNRLGGHSIKIGAGKSAARYRLGDPAEARAWLRAWLAQGVERKSA